MPMLSPAHPGEFIRTEIIEPLGLSVTAAAEVLGVSRPALSTLLNGKADLSGEMALRIEKAFGSRMDTLMRMQSAYDIARTRKGESKIRVRRYRSAEAMQEFVGIRKERSEFRNPVGYVRGLRRGSRIERLGK
jgi:addiction module HigA family antidote